MTGGITDGIGGRIRGLAARKTAPALEPMLLWADTNYPLGISKRFHSFREFSG